MTITRTEEFADGNRYQYDFGLCRDFAQVNTSEDASWFGIWACPSRLVVFTFCEGDCLTVQCDTAAEFCDELRKVQAFADRQGKFLGIDPGSDPVKVAAWEALGLGDLLAGLVGKGRPAEPGLARPAGRRR
jgi:hypothetical protein